MSTLTSNDAIFCKFLDRKPLFQQTSFRSSFLQEREPFLCPLSQLLVVLQVEYKKGWGKFKSGSEVEVQLADGGSETVKAKNIIIATGSEVSPLKGIDIDEER